MTCAQVFVLVQTEDPARDTDAGILLQEVFLSVCNARGTLTHDACLSVPGAAAQFSQRLI